MGTHPIFESDFDCLTVLEMLSRIIRIIPRNLSVTRCRAGFKNYDKPKSLFEKAKNIFVLISLGGVNSFGVYFIFFHNSSKNSCEENLNKDLLIFYQNLSDKDLKTVTKNALQELVSGLKNEDSDISNMFCSKFPSLEKKIRKEWKMLTENEKNFFGEKIWEDREMKVEKLHGGESFYVAISSIKSTKNVYATFKYDEETEKWLLQRIRFESSSIDPFVKNIFIGLFLLL